MGQAATIVFLALTAAKAVSQVSNASSRAKVVSQNASAKAEALKAEGDIAVKERAKEVRLRAARQASSFITSGLTLEGTPTDVIDETFEVGIADIENIGANFQTSRRNIISSGNAEAQSINRAGRTAAIGTIVSSFSSFGSAGSLFGSGQANRGAGGVPLPVPKPSPAGGGF